MIDEMLVDDLWENRADYCKDKNRQDKFCSCFGEVIENVHRGHEYTEEDAENTKYWKYLQSYHESWREKPISKRAYKQLKQRFFEGINLYHDIKNNGIKKPFDIQMKDGKRLLVTGNRRLIILKILGVKTVKVNIIE